MSAFVIFSTSIDIFIALNDLLWCETANSLRMTRHCNVRY